jgi:preprotein translocase subunit SecA
VAKEIARAQEIIEGQHSLMRRTLQSYSIVIEKYRLQLIRMKKEAVENGLFPLELLDRIEYAEETFLSKLFIHELDEFWVHFLAYLDYVKEGTHLRRFGKLEPLSEFISEANTAFAEGMMNVIEKSAEAIEEGVDADAPLLNKQRSGSTWTYQIDDNPFPSFSLALIGMDSAIGASVGPFLVLLAPFFLLKYLASKLNMRKKARLSK